MGVGAYTAVFLGGEAGRTHVGPRAADVGLAARRRHRRRRSSGCIVAPAAVRVRGLYLAIVTVGLVFIGIHLSRVFPEISGQSEVGRNFPPLEFSWWKEDEPVISFADDGHWLWFDVTGEQKSYLFALALLGVASSSPRTSCAREPDGRCRRSAIATSPPRSWACRSSATR